MNISISTLPKCITWSGSWHLVAPKSCWITIFCQPVSLKVSWYCTEHTYSACAERNYPRVDGPGCFRSEKVHEIEWAKGILPNPIARYEILIRIKLVIVCKAGTCHCLEDKIEIIDKGEGQIMKKSFPLGSFSVAIIVSRPAFTSMFTALATTCKPEMRSFQTWFSQHSLYDQTSSHNLLQIQWMVQIESYIEKNLFLYDILFL